MACVPGFAFDVFVSFAHADNQPFAGRPAWVTAFVKELNTYLGYYFRGRCSFFFDQRGSVQIGKPLPSELAQCAGNSAVFIAITSPNYVDPQSWGLDELNAFAVPGRDGQRIFPIELLPLESRREYPLALRELTRFKFWEPSEAQAPDMISLKSKKGREKIIGLGWQVKLHLEEMCNAVGPNNGDKS
jgi:TIR domain